MRETAFSCQFIGPKNLGGLISSLPIKRKKFYCTKLLAFVKIVYQEHEFSLCRLCTRDLSSTPLINHDAAIGRKDQIARPWFQLFIYQEAKSPNWPARRISYRTIIPWWNGRKKRSWQI